MEEEFKLPVEKNNESSYEVGRWYKTNKGDFYGKYLKLSSRKGFVASEYIITDYKMINYSFEPGYIWTLLEDLSEIQQYLPNNYPDKIIEEPKVPNCFKKGEYVVLISSCTGTNVWNDCLPENYCYKLREDSHSLQFYVELDILNNKDNGWSCSNGYSDNKLKLRKATEEEINEYNRLNKPYNIITLENKTENKITELEKDQYYYVEWGIDKSPYIFKDLNDIVNGININEKRLVKGFFNSKDNWKLIRKATEEEIQWLNICIKADMFISKEKALNSNQNFVVRKGDYLYCHTSLIMNYTNDIEATEGKYYISEKDNCFTNNSGNTKHETGLYPNKWFSNATEEEYLNQSKMIECKNKAIHCKTREEWNFVSEKLQYTWKNYNNWTSYKENSCINIQGNTFGKLSYYQKENYTIISFENWCKENNYIFKSNPNIDFSILEKDKWYEIETGYKWLIKFYNLTHLIYSSKRIALDGSLVARRDMNDWMKESVKYLKPANMEEVYKYFPEEKEQQKESLVGRYLKALVDTPQSISGRVKGDYFKILKEDDNNLTIRELALRNLKLDASISKIGTVWELMPKGFNPDNITEEQWIPKVGEWVVFIPEIAKELGYYTHCWNKPYVIRIKEVSANSLTFSNKEMRRVGYSTDTTCGNDIKCFRKALPHEIPNNIEPKEQSMEEILEEAKRRYPIGTKFKNINTNNNTTYEIRNELQIQGTGISHYGIDYIYLNGKWAEIVKEVEPKLEPIIWKTNIKYENYHHGIDPINEPKKLNNQTPILLPTVKIKVRKK